MFRFLHIFFFLFIYLMHLRLMVRRSAEIVSSSLHIRVHKRYAGRKDSNFALFIFQLSCVFGGGKTTNHHTHTQVRTNLMQTWIGFVRLSFTFFSLLLLLAFDFYVIIHGICIIIRCWSERLLILLLRSSFCSANEKNGEFQHTFTLLSCLIFSLHIDGAFITTGRLRTG